MHTKEGIKKMRDTNKAKYNNVEEYFNSLSKPAKAAFKIGIRYAIKCMRDSETSKEQINAMMSVLAK